MDLRGLFVAASIGVLAACLPKPPPPATPEALPRPYRKRQAAAVSLNATCTGCHEAEAAEWSGSLHRRSYANAAFQTALAREPSAFCRGCHAPESDPETSPPDDVAALGVGCVTCHVADDGAILTSADHPPRGAPHSVRRSVALARTGGCAGCHEFAFPTGHARDDADLMQTTVREHARSPAADSGCATCHMPRAGGRRSHAFADVRDPGWLRSRLRVEPARVTDGARLTLAQTAPGHAFPTGDLFRRLEVGAELRAEDGRVLRRDVRYLARHFDIVPGRVGRFLTADDRVLFEPRVVDLALGAGASAHDVRWWVNYQRVASAGTGEEPENAMIESEVPLYSGVLQREEKR